MKKALALILAAAISTGLLASCGGGGDTGSGQQAPQAADSPADTAGDGGSASGGITLITWDGTDVPGMQAVAGKFTEQNPDIQVQVEAVPWDDYWTKLMAAAQSGDMPDIFQMHFARFEKFIFGEVLLPLDGIVEDSLWDSYPATLVDPYIVDGNHYGIPTELFMNMLFYNKEIFDDAGLDYPDENWGWDDLVEASVALTDRERNIYGFGARNHTTEGYDSFIYQNGGTVLTDDRRSGFDLPATQEAIQWWADFSLRHESSPTMAQFAETDLIQRFTSGGMAMAVLDSWRIAPFNENDDIKDKFDVAVLPHGKQEAALFSSPAWVVPTGAQNLDAATTFLRWFTTEEGQNLYSEYVRLSARNGCQQIFYDKHSNINAEYVVNKTKEIGIPVPSTKDKDDWSNYEQEVMGKILSGELPVADGCQQIADYMNDVIDNEY